MPEKLPPLPFDPGILKTAMDRVASRVARGEPRPSVSLPEEKSSAPKLVCLDQNKWIELSRVHYGRSQDPHGVVALEAIRRAVAQQRVIVPVMDTNLSEVAEPADAERRRRLASFMVELSGNLSCLATVPLRRDVIARAIRRAWLEEADVPPVRPQLVHRGMGAAAIGKPAGPAVEGLSGPLARILREAMCEPEISVEMLVTAIDQGAVRQQRARDIQGVPVLDAARQVHGRRSASERRLVEMRNLLASGHFAATFDEVIGEVAPDRASWRSDDDKLQALLEHLPQVDVQMSLLFTRDRNPQDRTAANDFKDLQFLSQAIPYANVVVTENRWAHIASSSGIANRYETRVIASLRDLPELLCD